MSMRTGGVAKRMPMCTDNVLSYLVGKYVSACYIVLYALNVHIYEY